MVRFTLAAVCLAVLAVVVGCGDSGPTEKRLTESEKADLALRAKGEAAFKNAGCVKCHVAGPELQVRSGPDLTYYAQRPRAGFGAARLALTPGNGRAGCVTVADATMRDTLAAFLGMNCVLASYERPSGQTAVCPVTGLKVDVKKPGAWREHGGTNYYFPDENSAQKFDVKPAHFAK